MRRFIHVLLATLCIAPTVVVAQRAGVAPIDTSRVITIAAVLDRVRTTHPLVTAAEQRADAARGSQRSARTWANPVFTYSEENAAFPGRAAPMGMERQLSAFVMLPLEPIYQLGPAVRQANRALDAAVADVAETRQRVGLDAARAFYGLASAQVAVDAINEVLQWTDSLVNYVSIRVREGAAAEGDLIRLQVERDRSDADLTMVRADLRRAQAGLSQFTGRDSAIVSVPETPLGRTDLPPRDRLLDAAKVQRPELIAARARVAAARAGRDMERASVVREVSAMAGSMSTGGVHSFMAGVTFPLPLFNQNRGEIGRATGEWHAMEAEAAMAERQILAEVASNYDIVHSYADQLNRLQAGGFLQRASESRRIAEGTYREGAAPLTQLLDAARTLVDAKQTYFRTLFAQQLSVIELNAAVGAVDLLKLPAMSNTAPGTRTDRGERQ